MSSQKQTNTTPPEYHEFKLKVAPITTPYNVMILPSSAARLNTFAEPVRMFRDKNSALINEPTPEELAAAGAGKPGKTLVAAGRTSKKKTRIVYQNENEEDSYLRETESIPWLLEDFDGQNSYVGKLEGGQNSNYVVFVNDADAFHIIPVSKWYRFQPKLSYHTLSLEEAEKEMAVRNKDEVDRWLMKNRSKSGASTPDDDEKGAAVKGKKGIKERLMEKVISGAKPVSSTGTTFSSVNRASKLANLKKRGGDDREEIDFDEIFDDDEGNDNFGGLEDEGGEDGGEKTLKKKNYKLSDEGRMMKRIVKTLDKSNDIMYVSDDEKDPYASSDEEEDFDKLSLEEEKSSEAGSKQATASVKPPLIPSAVQAKKDSGVAVSAPAKPTAAKLAASGASSTTSSPAKSKRKDASEGGTTKKAKTAAAKAAAATESTPPVPTNPDDCNITEDEVIAYIKEKPITTKDLIAKIKWKIAINPNAKDQIRELVRKVASVDKVASDASGERYLQLKPEYGGPQP